MSAAPAPQPFATRSATACIRCRRQKTKCLHDDNGQPCRGCLKAQQQCMFPGKVPRAPRAPVIAGLPLLTNNDNNTAHSTQYKHSHDAPDAEKSDPAGQLELHPNHIQDCERSLALWPFPCFHRPSFMRQLKEGHLPQTLNYAILTTGARASSNLNACDYFAKKAHANLDSSMDCPSVPDVQSLCLLAMHHWGSGRGTRAYVYLGMATRMAQLFLPQATSRDQDFVAAETARRAIWTCFTMDQFLACGTGRPSAMRADDLHIQLPCSEGDFHFGSSVITPTLNGDLPSYASTDCASTDAGEFGHMIRISILWNRAISWVMDPPGDEQDDTEYHRILDSLHHWAKSLPSRQQDTPGKIEVQFQVGNGYSFAFTHSVYYCALIFLARKQLHRMGRRTGDRDTEADATAAIDTISRAAQRVIALITTFDDNASFLKNTTPVYPIVVLFATYTSASAIANLALQNVLLPDIHHPSLSAPNGAATADNKLLASIVTPALKILEKSIPAWPLAQRWDWELRRLKTKLETRTKQSPTPERHDSRLASITNSNGSRSSSAAAGHWNPLNGHAYQGQQNGTGSPSPFTAAWGSAPLSRQEADPAAAAQSVARDGSAEGHEQDSAAFDEHLKGVGDLATFLGTDGFGY